MAYRALGILGVDQGLGVTLSLASLGLGFQQDHYGLFLIAAVSGLAFWMVEATKGHQMRYYPRDARPRGHCL